MRIDQYLKFVRVVKKRPVSKELSAQNRILINGKAAKAASDVKINDEVDVYFGHRHLKIRVLEIPLNLKHAMNSICYEVLLEERIQVQESSSF